MSGEAAGNSRILPDWAEIIEGDAPILLIAPHGGRALPGAADRPDRKINDLYTVEITRELAARVGASAILNTAMDRNRLDCNRLPQVMAGAPWMVTKIAEKIEGSLAVHRRAVVLTIHGWNVVEPRIDIGVGLRDGDGVLRLGRGAFVSVSEQFLNGALARLVAMLRRADIAVTLGMRYPAGGAENLIQAITGRRRESPVEILRRLSTLAETGAVEAAQIELSMAVRIPGTFRRAALDSLSKVLSERHGAASYARRVVVSATASTPGALNRSFDSRRGRLGIEFHSPAQNIGVVASFDAGRAGGGRLMILLPDGAVMLFTADGGVNHYDGRISAGALIAERIGAVIRLHFHGPVLITPPGVAYTEVERALAMSALEEAARFSLEIDAIGDCDLDTALEKAGAAPSEFLTPAFGAARGHLSFGSRSYQFTGVARIGSAVTSPAPADIHERWRLWACLPGSRWRAIELEEASNGSGKLRAGRWLDNDKIAPVSFGLLESAGSSKNGASRAIALDFGQRELLLTGRVEGSIPLIRSFGKSRFHTALEFVSFALDGDVGAGILEITRRLDGRVMNPSVRTRNPTS